MTNFEWVKSDDERLKDVLTHSLAVNADTGKVVRCSETACGNCSFNGHGPVRCNDLREEWLNKEHKHEPLYENGDIVISKNGKIYLVFREYESKCVVVCDNVDDLKLGSIGSHISKDEIKRKIGNIFDCDNKEV